MTQEDDDYVPLADNDAEDGKSNKRKGVRPITVPL